MKRRLVILNNGLKDQCGHYFETSIAIAEAARELGLRPVLATHVDCPVGLFPDWLEVYPIFCTDHWMGQPPATAPDLGRLRLDPYGGPPIRADDVRQGKARVRDLVSSRFNLDWLAPPAPPAGPSLSQQAAEAKRLAWLCNRLSYYLVPPAVQRMAQALSRGVCDWTPRVVWPEDRKRLMKWVMRQWRVLRGVERRSPPRRAIPYQGPPIVAAALNDPLDGPIITQALERLTAAGLSGELVNSLTFKRDLERLVALLGLVSRDHVLMGTAHGREVLAVALVVRRLGEDRSPMFHLEFRHPLFIGPPCGGAAPVCPAARTHLAFFELYRDLGHSHRMLFYTDSEELSHEHTLYFGLHFGVLPLPFRTRMMKPAPMPDGRPLVLGYVGEARDEKGFPWLPMLIDWLMESHVRPGKVQFLVQATLNPGPNPLSIPALELLRRYPPDVVQLAGTDGPLSPEDYYKLLTAADIVLLPYDRFRYRACSSGTLAEVIAGGRPVVVPEGTWLSANMPAGGGETFQDFISFVDAVRRVADNFEAYRRVMEAARAGWLARHSPRALVEAIMQSKGDVAAAARAA